MTRNHLELAQIIIVAVGWLVFPGTSQASSLPRLVVNRSAEAADCPDAPALALIIEKQMQRAVLDPSPNGSSRPDYEVTIDRSADGFMATIRSGELTRELSDPGSTCSELADALALTLTIMLDSEPPVAPAKPSEVTEVRPSAPVPPIQIRVILPSVRQWNWGLAGAVGETVGFLAPFSFVMLPEVWFRYRSALFSSGAFLVPWSTAESEQLAVNMQLFTGFLSGCGRIAGKNAALHLDLCGQSFLGTISGEGVGFKINREGSQPWLAFGAAVLLEGPLFRQIEWSLRLNVTVPVVTHRFYGTRPATTDPNAPEVSVTLFDPPKLGGFLAFGFRWSIL